MLTKMTHLLEFHDQGHDGGEAMVEQCPLDPALAHRARMLLRNQCRQLTQDKCQLLWLDLLWGLVANRKTDPSLNECTELRPLSALSSWNWARREAAKRKQVVHGSVRCHVQSLAHERIPGTKGPPLNPLEGSSLSEILKRIPSSNLISSEWILRD